MALSTLVGPVVYNSPILIDALFARPWRSARHIAWSGSDQIEGTEATRGPRRPKGLVMATQGREEHPAAASRRGTLGKKYRTTRCLRPAPKGDKLGTTFEVHPLVGSSLSRRSGGCLCHDGATPQFHFGRRRCWRRSSPSYVLVSQRGRPRLPSASLGNDAACTHSRPHRDVCYVLHCCAGCVHLSGAPSLRADGCGSARRDHGAAPG